MSTVAQPGATPSPRWIANAPVDLLVGCGAWTLPLLALTFVASSRQLFSVAALFYILTLFCNNPHYMATIYRAYGTRDDVARYRVVTVYVTVLLGATALVAHWAPRLVPWLVTAYLTWSPWHYTGQNFGLAMMWARRNGATPTRADRNALWAAFLASYAAWFLWMHSVEPEDTNVLSLGIPAALADPARVALIVVFLGAGLYALARLVRESRLTAMLGVLILFSTQGLWFVLPALLELALGREQPPAYYSAGVLAFMHCAQYLWITSFYAKRETEAGVRGAGGRWNPWRYYLILVVGGVALFLPGPWMISTLFRHDLTDSLLIFAALVNLHHFIVDGAVWKLREGRVAALLLGTRAPAEPRLTRAETMPTRAARWLAGPKPGARALRWGLLAALLGVALADQAQYVLTSAQAGERRLDAAAWLNRHDSRVSVRRAKLLVDRGDVSGAIAELQGTLELNPRHASALRMLGSLLVQSGQYAQAYAHYDLVEQRVRPDLSTLMNVGVLSAQAGDSRRAEERLLQALRLAPDHADAHLNLAEVYMARGEFASAIPRYRAFLALEGSGPPRPRLALVVLLKLGEALATTGRPDEARAVLAELRERAERQGDLDLAAAARARLVALGSR
jgi:Tfp pilus assembly protein PilF